MQRNFNNKLNNCNCTRPINGLGILANGLFNMFNDLGCTAQCYLSFAQNPNMRLQCLNNCNNPAQQPPPPPPPKGSSTSFDSLLPIALIGGVIYLIARK